jgi:hypothetical protein
VLCAGHRHSVRASDSVCAAMHTPQVFCFSSCATVSPVVPVKVTSSFPACLQGVLSGSSEPQGP